MNFDNPNVVWTTKLTLKEDRNRLNGHKSCFVLLTGLSGAGKSTIASEVDRVLFQLKIRSYVLDGDNLRHGLNKNLGFSPEDRRENVIRAAEVGKLFVDAGIITLAALISPYKSLRDEIRSYFKTDEYIEVFIDCPLDECERRDVKGLYKKARAGQISNFTGISERYEAPIKPDIVIDSNLQNINESANQIIKFLKKENYI